MTCKKNSPSTFILFLEFVFKVKLGGSAKATLVQLFLLLCGSIGLGFTVAALVFNNPIINFVGFWYLLLFYTSFMHLREQLSETLSESGASDGYSRFCIVLPFLSMPFFLCMLCDFLLYLLTLPLSLVFYNADSSDFDFYCLQNFDDVCNILSDVPWTFSFRPLLALFLVALGICLTGVGIPLVIMIYGGLTHGILIFGEEDLLHFTEQSFSIFYCFSIQNIQLVFYCQFHYLVLLCSTFLLLFCQSGFSLDFCPL
ncbi:hypothetical protein GEMRC1_000042 [Eukaryota sp. GEM-RC1]